ncbi:MAG: glutathione synthase, partial [Arenimonas sp.]
MSIACAVVMDPINAINTTKDSTFAMLLEAQRRGYALYYIKPGSLSVRSGKAWAQMASLRVIDRKENWYELSDQEARPLTDVQIVLMRNDPPVDSNYLHDSIILSLAQKDGVLIMNDPQGLRDLNEKLAALLFPQCCPETLVSRDKAELKTFAETHGEVVLKPLDGMGGRSIFRSHHGDTNLNVIIETLTDNGKALVMAQRYIPEISAGDKRILLIDGEPVPYCLARIPQGTEFRGNLAAGGRGEGRPLS